MAKHVDAPGTIVLNEASPGGGESASKSAMNKFKAMDARRARLNNRMTRRLQKRLEALAVSRRASKRSAAVKQWQAAAAVGNGGLWSAGGRAKAVGPRAAEDLKRTQSAATIKQCLLDWCKAVTAPIGNGFHPEAFDFNELSAANRKRNFELAFETAESTPESHRYSRRIAGNHAPAITRLSPW
uniref:BZIP domain-containing protein n=1 Tax=Macrostomum lignano TaxID=282301 RepID=A0A1I8F9Q3_9PLAT